METVFISCSEKMEKAIDSLKRDFAKLRTGRASINMLDDIKADYYGTPTIISQLASVSTPDSHSLTIQPWDKGAFAPIEKAIRNSDLGINPVNDGKSIRISLPPLTEERRKDLVKLAKKYTEECKTAIRNIRREANETLKKMKTEKEITEDDLRGAETRTQTLTDNTILKAEKTLNLKEKEIMEI